MKSLNRSLPVYFWISILLLLFASLGSREVWTQEWRWGEVLRVMQFHHDYFHPLLAGKMYFDKPLLSYWLMAIITKLTSSSTFAIRLPSAIAGLISILCLYQIGKKWLDDSVGQLAAIMLASTYYFVFWARTASSDLLNLAGILCAVAWYLTKRDQPNFTNYSLYWIILAVTALFKGLVGPIIALLVIVPDLLMQPKKHLRGSLLLAMIPAVLIYLLPFYITSLINHTSLADSGLSEVYRENVLRFFEPFDHKGSFFTYFIYLPVYLLPWTFFFFPAIYQLSRKWKGLDIGTKQLLASNALIFLFLTLSGSRRSYYILPLLPFAILITAKWILFRQEATACFSRKKELSVYTAIFSFCSLLCWFVLIQPLYYSDGGLPVFAHQLKERMSQEPHKNWRIIFLNADNRLSFYLPDSSIDFLKSDLSKVSAFEPYDILVIPKSDLNHLKFKSHSIVEMKSHLGNRWLHKRTEDGMVALFLDRAVLKPSPLTPLP